MRNSLSGLFLLAASIVLCGGSQVLAAPDEDDRGVIKSGAWETTHGYGRMGEKIIFLNLPAVTVNSEETSETRASLLFVCMRTQVLILAYVLLSEDVDIAKVEQVAEYRIDDDIYRKLPVDLPEKLYAGIENRIHGLTTPRPVGSAFSFKYPGWIRSMIFNLRKSRELNIRLYPRSDSEIDIMFRTDGLMAIEAESRKLCAW